MGVSPAHPADHRAGELDDPVRDLRRCQDMPHQDEKGRRDQRERVRRTGHFLRQDRDGQPAENQEDQCGQHHRDVERHSGEDGGQPATNNSEHQAGHSGALLS